MEILDRCHNAISDLTKWAIYAKNKGGIGYVGLKPDTPFQVYIGTKAGAMESRTNEFESMKLDMNESVSTLIGAHKALCICLEEIIDFIGLERAYIRFPRIGSMIFLTNHRMLKSIYEKIERVTNNCQLIVLLICLPCPSASSWYCAYTYNGSISCITTIPSQL